jgi:hypothetical protein
MTDEELIAMARLAQRDERMSTGALYGDLADRIEALLEQCEGLAQVVDYNWVKHQRVIAAEAKLAKAVEALREIEADCDADYPPSHGAIKHAIRAVLAELEGEG